MGAGNSGGAESLDSNGARGDGGPVEERGGTGRHDEARSWSMAEDEDNASDGRTTRPALAQWRKEVARRGDVGVEEAPCERRASVSEGGYCSESGGG